ncbi:MAG: M3 family metallopeptidase [Prevotella sp.]|nr:M3 family metallopeptidase [Prevotella sp.]
MEKDVNTGEKQRQNPFFADYDTPHGVVPFDKIALGDYEEAIIEGIRRDDEKIALIVSNPAEPTFDNTLIYHDATKGDSYYDLLDRVSAVLSCMLSCETCDKLEALAQKMSPLLTKHANDISLNPQLFAKIKRVHDHHRALSPEEAMLLDNAYKGFVRSGALLDEAGKKRLRELTEEAALLSLQFSQNLLKERKAYELYITDEKQLAGMPQTALDAARAAAEEHGKNSGFVFTLDAPSYTPFMTYCRDRSLRKEMYMAYNTLCIKDNAQNNLAICSRLINLRRETAQLLGYNTYADFVLEHRMATSVENVYHLLDELLAAYKPAAEKEQAELVATAKKTEGGDFELMPWDSAYYSHKLRMERYNIDAEMLRPYLKLENVVSGVFSLAETLYGITFKEAAIPVYHPDVKAYEVFDSDGSFLAVLYADFFPRKGKRGGAWMTEFQEQWIDRKGNNVRPHVSVVMNFTKPTPEKPALLTFGEVETFLHEFGHALHGMFANTRFASLSGTNVWWDFVELPSQFMENFAVEKAFLRTFAVHYETGEPLPDELIGRIVKSRNFMVGTACLRQISFGLLDMAYHTQTSEFQGDIIAFEKQAWAKAILGKQLPETCMTAQFSHIMAGGYAAGYYSYKWAEVLDADAFAVFKKEGIFNRATAQRFRDCILSKGGTEHPMALYKKFRGAEPDIEALLQRNGIKRETKQA